ncbi:hypothetical protein D3C87_2009400 [compost metagenome]
MGTYRMFGNLEFKRYLFIGKVIPAAHFKNFFHFNRQRRNFLFHNPFHFSFPYPVIGLIAITVNKVPQRADVFIFNLLVRNPVDDPVSDCSIQIS